jgi:phage FluMu protein Com
MHLDDIKCKHCGALVALVSKQSVVGRFTLRCPHCGVLRVVWPVQKVYNPPQQQEVAA